MNGGTFIAFIICLCLCLIPGKIASKKGRSFGGFFFFALCSFPLALLVALFISPKKTNENNGAADPTAILLQYKELLDTGTITQEEYDKVKKDFLETGKIDPPVNSIPAAKGYKCSSCGAVKTGWYDTCPECGAKNTMVKLGEVVNDTLSVDKQVMCKELLNMGAITQEEFDEFTDVPKVAEYKCTACGAIKNGWYDTCSECGAKNTMIKVENNNKSIFSVEVLYKYKKLLDLGAITQEEFENVVINLHTLGQIATSVGGNLTEPEN